MSYVESCDKHGQYHADYICGDCVDDLRTKLAQHEKKLQTAVEALEKVADWYGSQMRKPNEPRSGHPMAIITANALTKIKNDPAEDEDRLTSIEKCLESLPHGEVLTKHVDVHGWNNSTSIEIHGLTTGSGEVIIVSEKFKIIGTEGSK